MEICFKASLWLTLEVGYLVKRGKGFDDITGVGSEELQHMAGVEHVGGEGDQFPGEEAIQ